jgi:serine protease Do
MNRPENFDQNPDNENREYDMHAEGKGIGDNNAEPSQEPHWYGISYQHRNGEYMPPVSFYEVESDSKKKKGTKLALLAACVLILALIAALGVGVWYVASHQNPDISDFGADTPGTATSGEGAPDTGGGTTYDAVDDSSYNYSGVTISKNDGTGLLGHSNGSAGDGAGTTISTAAKVKDAVVEILTTQSNRYQTITAGVGSGVIIHADGIIVTNHHVIDGLETIYVRLTNGNTYKAVVRGSDEEGDIAIIKIDPKETLTVAPLGNSNALALGEPVIAIGNPLGELGGTVTSGIISATQRAIQVDGIMMTLIQTNAAINSGNSGGGLFNMAGELIGVVNAKISAEGVEGLGFAIPIDTAFVSINHLLKLGYIPGTPALGVSVTGYKYSWRQGIYTYSVYMPCIVENNGELKQGDYIYSVNGTTVYASDANTALELLKTAIRAHEVGDQLTVQVIRDGQKVNIQVTLVEYVPTDESVEFE